MSAPQPLSEDMVRAFPLLMSFKDQEIERLKREIYLLHQQVPYRFELFPVPWSNERNIALMVGKHILIQLHFLAEQTWSVKELPETQQFWLLCNDEPQILYWERPQGDNDTPMLAIHLYDSQAASPQAVCSITVASEQGYALLRQFKDLVRLQ